MRLLLPFAFLVSTALGQTPVERANQAFADGNLKEAERLYLIVLQTEPRSYEALYKYGLVLLKSKRPAEAADYLNRASLVRPTAPEPYIARANAYLDLGKTDTALAALVNGQQACERLAVYWIMRGSIEARLQKYDDARTSLKRACRNEPNNPLIAYQAGTTFVSIGDAQSAEECFRASFAIAPQHPTYAAALAETLHNRKNYPEAAATAKRGLTYNPSDRVLLSIYARAIAAHLPVETALREIESLAEVGVEAPRVSVAKAALYISLGKHSEALIVLDAAISAQPSDPDARLLRASARLASGDHKGAIEDTEAALSSPDHVRIPELYEIRYTAFAALKRPAQTERALRSWILAVPTDTRPYYLLAEVLLERQAHAEAAAVAEALLRLSPDDDRALDLAASAHLTIGRANRVMELVEGALSRGKKTPNLYINLALAQKQQGEVSKALATLKEMRETFPQDSRGWTLAGAMLESALRFQAAHDIYEDLLKTHPYDEAALVGVARTLAQLEKHVEAAEAYVALADAIPHAVSAFIAAYTHYRAAGVLEKAAQMWATRLKARESDVPFLGAYARYLIAEKKYSEAIGVYRQMIALNADNPQPYRAGAEVFEVMGDRAQAFELLLSGIGRFFGDRDYLEHFRKAAIEAGMVAEYDKALDGLFEQGFYSHASVTAFVDSRDRRGLLAEATALLRDAAARQPGSAPLWAGLSRALSLAGDSQQSLVALERAADAEPSNRDVVAAFASAAERLNDSAHAAKAFRMLSELLPGDPGPVLKAAGYLAELGQKDAALALLRDADSRIPGNPEISAMIRTLGG